MEALVYTFLLVSILGIFFFAIFFQNHLKFHQIQLLPRS